jgi:ribonuclease T1
VFWSGLAERRGLRKKEPQVIRKWGLAVVLALGSVAASGVQAKGPAAEPVPLAQLPEPAQQTYQRVLGGGPFPYHKDGITFANREHRLPGKARGYYREYTVDTPGSSDRGARRIVCGGTQPTQPDSCYYTADHYASFARIVP